MVEGFERKREKERKFMKRKSRRFSNSSNECCNCNDRKNFREKMKKKLAVL